MLKRSFPIMYRPDNKGLRAIFLEILRYWSPLTFVLVGRQFPALFLLPSSELMHLWYSGCSKLPSSTTGMSFMAVCSLWCWVCCSASGLDGAAAAMGPECKGIYTGHRGKLQEKHCTKLWKRPGEKNSPCKGVSTLLLSQILTSLPQQGLTDMLQVAVPSH